MKTVQLTGVKFENNLQMRNNFVTRNSVTV